jgi:DNA-binding response OmpR family regulator
MNDRPRALVCDDESQSLRALRVILRDAGSDVCTTQTAEEALDRAALSAPDAAIVELVLPDGDGVELCRQLREWSTAAITHTDLLRHGWGAAYAQDRQTLRAHMANLRRKVCPADGLSLIRTDHGVGYRFTDSDRHC